MIRNGNFVAHPLDGGATPTTDATSPITMAVNNGNTTAVTFAAVGDYPYFCTVHLANMQGVMYVR